MSLCTSPNPWAECRRRVNYICISWCWPDNPFIHTPQSSASRCVYHNESPTLSSHNVCLGGFHFVSYAVTILESQQKSDKAGCYNPKDGCPEEFQFDPQWWKKAMHLYSSTHLWYFPWECYFIFHWISGVKIEFFIALYLIDNFSQISSTSTNYNNKMLFIYIDALRSVVMHIDIR